jgi:hypothetical protein
VSHRGMALLPGWGASKGWAVGAAGVGAVMERK